MSIKGIVILIVAISFISVTAIGWDNYLALLEQIWIKFIEFIEGGIDEAAERMPIELET